ncbi:hypothetical protein TNCV_4429711 [Trichonephila clavipes]|nr:hypothetical protein TNCV_4429711 [Trichonephila clavipes]
MISKPPLSFSFLSLGSWRSSKKRTEEGCVANSGYPLDSGSNIRATLGIPFSRQNVAPHHEFNTLSRIVRSKTFEKGEEERGRIDSENERFTRADTRTYGPLPLESDLEFLCLPLLFGEENMAFFLLFS